jgi:hypothetical protein
MNWRATRAFPEKLTGFADLNEVGRYVGDAAANGNRFCRIRMATRTCVREPLKFSTAFRPAEISG